MILASMLALAALQPAAAPVLSAPVTALEAPVCTGAPGRPSLCRPAAAVKAVEAEAGRGHVHRVAVAACHPDPGKNRGCFRRSVVGESALALKAPVREDAR